MRCAVQYAALILCLALIAGAREASGGDESAELTAEEIRDLAERPDDRSAVPDEMKVFAEASELTVTVTSAPPGERGEPSPPVTAREKFVDGRYLVSYLRPPGADKDLVMVVYYDEAETAYQKRVLLPDGSVHRMIGTRAGKSRVLSWVNIPPEGENQPMILGQENHSDQGVVWREVVISGGKVVRIMTGKAVVTKRPDTKRQK